MVVFGYETLDTINNRDGNMATKIPEESNLPRIVARRGGT